MVIEPEGNFFHASVAHRGGVRIHGMGWMAWGGMGMDPGSIILSYPWDGMDGMGWDGMGWDGNGSRILRHGMAWDGMGWDGMGWDGMNGMGWDGMGWDGMAWDGLNFFERFWKGCKSLKNKLFSDAVAHGFTKSWMCTIMLLKMYLDEE